MQSVIEESHLTEEQEGSRLAYALLPVRRVMWLTGACESRTMAFKGTSLFL